MQSDISDAQFREGTQKLREHNHSSSNGKVCVRAVPIFIFLAEGENNGQGVVGDGFVEQAVEVQALQVLLLAHKPPQGRCPALRQNLRSIPLRIRNVTIHCVFDINYTPGSTACPAR